MGKVQKMVIKIVLIVVIVVACCGIWFFTTVSSVNKEHAPAEAVVGTGDRSALVIYEPSRLSTTKDMSMAIADTLAGAGYTVTVNFPSSRLDYDLEDYDVIAFGTPVYAGQVSSALKSYVESNPVEGKHVLVYVTGASPDDTKELDEMVSWVNAANSVSSIKVTKDDGERLSAFVKESLAQ